MSLAHLTPSSVAFPALASRGPRSTQHPAATLGPVSGRASICSGRGSPECRLQWLQHQQLQQQHLSSSKAASRRPQRGARLQVAAGAMSAQVTRVTFANPSGEQLAGVLHEVDGKADAPAVVLCHGYMDSKDSNLIGGLAAALQGAGLAALRFDFAGNGESQGEFDFCAYAKEVEDIRAAVEFLRSRGRQVHAVLGHSKGAAEVLLYAAKYGDVPKVVSLSARFNMVRGITERFGEDIFERLRRGGALEMKGKLGRTWTLKHESVMERINTDMAVAAAAIPATVRVLTVHGAADDVIPVDDAHDFDQRIQTHELHVIPLADHNYTKEHYQPMESIVVGWLSSSA